jgi:hypothetical protein
MCLECDGYSHEEVMQALDLRIRVHGWTLVQVVDGTTTWCYTVGLVENHGHPELVLFDVRTESQQELMNQLVGLVIDQGELPPAVLAAMGLRVGDVHVDHLESDLFGTWANRYGELPRPGDMVHVRLPDSAYCPCHATSVRRLDLPGPLPALATAHPAPNRAERRRRGHRGPST